MSSGLSKSVSLMLLERATKPQRWASVPGDPVGTLGLEEPWPRPGILHLRPAGAQSRHTQSPEQLMELLHRQCSKLSLEIVATPESMRYQLAAPPALLPAISALVYAIYPESQLEVAGDALAQVVATAPAHPAAVAMEYRQEQLCYFPLGLRSEAQPHLLTEGMLQLLTSLAAGERVIYQLLLAPADWSWNLLGLRKLTDREGRPRYPRERDVLARQKLSQSLFIAAARVLIVTPRAERALQLAHGINSVLTVLNHPYLNALVPHACSAADQPVRNFVLRYPVAAEAVLLSSSEIAALWAPPEDCLRFPTLIVAGARRTPAPQAVLRPVTGLVLGRAEGPYQSLVFLPQEARESHIAIFGSTRTGKTTSLENFFYQDAQAGRGVAILEPHGDFAERALGLIPPERAEDVIYFDPADEEHPVAFNPLEAGGARPALLYGALITMFTALWSQYLGPRLMSILRYAIASLMGMAGATLADVARMLTSAEYRYRVVQQLPEGAAREFWEDRFANWSSSRQTEAVEPILNKLDAFLGNPLLHRILTQRHSAFDFRQVMDQRRILICNLSRGLLGDENAFLLGMLILIKLQLAALTRIDTPIERRVPFHVYIDEFQRFHASVFPEVLAEAGKFKVSLVTANQYLGQLSDETREAILGTVGTLIAFRVGPTDARVLNGYFAPVSSPEDLQRLDNYHAYVRMMAGGKAQRAFSLATLPPPPADLATAARIRELSRQRYGRRADQAPPAAGEERRDEHKPRFYE